MARTLTIPNCTVEITLPTLELTECYPSTKLAIKIRATEHVEGLVVRYGDKTMRINKLLLHLIAGQMLPTIDEHGIVTLFTIDPDPQPDVAAASAPVV